MLNISRSKAEAYALSDDKGSKDKVSTRQRIATYLAASVLGLALDVMNTSLSILACILYIIELYVEDALYPAYNDNYYGVSWQFLFFVRFTP